MGSVLEGEGVLTAASKAVYPRSAFEYHKREYADGRYCDGLACSEV